jgi:hypothetical protein
MPHSIVKNIAFEQTTAALSVTAGAATWMQFLQGWLQLIATAVAIVAGGLAIYSHFKRNRK